MSFIQTNWEFIEYPQLPLSKEQKKCIESIKNKEKTLTDHLEKMNWKELDELATKFHSKKTRSVLIVNIIKVIHLMEYCKAILTAMNSLLIQANFAQENIFSKELSRIEGTFRPLLKQNQRKLQEIFRKVKYTLDSYLRTKPQMKKRLSIFYYVDMDTYIKYIKELHPKKKKLSY